ncbi:unnamed protein product [Polarella glacialis]|uniref:C3H1-type domain-containing protein n=1 Tax=Polarella glacialis TaxID=89957 RepID=A0A813GCN3_POLGL|nr:unnamed protein product [Polarella glacialis]
MQTELETVQRSDQCINSLALEPKKSPPVHTVFTSLPSTMQCMQVKNTFIHFHFASDKVEGVLRRSSSSPAILKTDTSPEASAEVSTEASADTSPVKTCLLEEKLLAHRQGKCKPCGYHYFKVDGCRQGDDCEFCHLCSLDEVKDRKRSGKKQARAIKRRGEYMAPFQSRSDSSRFSPPSIPT